MPSLGTLHATERSGVPANCEMVYSLRQGPFTIYGVEIQRYVDFFFFILFFCR